MAPRIQITFDCWNVHMMCGWWAERLGYVVEDGHVNVQQQLESGDATADDVMTVNGRLAFANATSAIDPDGRGPRLYFASVPEAKTAKNRVHLDVSREDRDLDVVVKEYIDAGASFTELGHGWAVMADPEGNEFCIH
jgi:hypothetical protein